MLEIDYIETQRKGKLICDDNLLSLIRSKFSVPNEAAKYAKRWGKRVADRLYSITPTGLFEFGLFAEIIKYVNSMNITVSYSKSFLNRLTSNIKSDVIVDNLTHNLRDYQKETIEKCLKVGQGTIVIGTGGGKSLITASLIENIINNKQGLKCLIVVPGISLVDQLKNDFQSYNVSFSFSTWTAKSEKKDTDVIITNSENLLAKFGDNPSLTNVDLLIVDEVHTISSKNKISKAISKFKTPNRFGFTGTLPKTEIDMWKIIGTFGPVIYEKNSKELRDEGFLTNVFVKMIKLKHGKVKKMDYNQELDYIYNHQKRNEIIKKITNGIKGNTLILVNHLEHGYNLNNILSTLTNKRVYFIQGETDINERSNVIKELSDSDNLVVIAMSKIFATGINAPNIHNLLFVSGGKAFIRTVQGIGRGLRLHHTKNKLTIIDIYDSLKYSERHAVSRQEIYDDQHIEWSNNEITL